MSLLGRKKDTEPEPLELADAEAVDPSGASSARSTAPKGRPTPKRDTARRRGPVAPAPMTSAEARRRRKEVAGPKLSREERTAAKAQRRERMSERRTKMMAGEEGFLLPRDKGPVRRYVRDLVDSRRNLLGLFMPAAFALILLMFSVPQVYILSSPIMLALVAIMVIDGVFIGRRVNGLVDEKFPNNTETGWKLGFYAASRASQLRRMRAPRPQVNRGEFVT